MSIQFNSNLEEALHTMEGILDRSETAVRSLAQNSPPIWEKNTTVPVLTNNPLWDCESRRLDDLLKREKLVRQIGALINRNHELKETLEAVTRMVCEFFKADRSVIYRYEYDESLERYFYRLAAQYCATEEIPEIIEDEACAHSVRNKSVNDPENDQPVMIVASTAEDCLEALKNYTCKLDIPMENPEAVLSHYLTHSRTKSVLGIEIRYRGILLGGILLHQCNDHRTWYQEDLELLQDIATHLGAALYQAEILFHQEQARQRAEQATSRKNLFLANMSHELRTPLNAVIGYSDMLKAGIAGEINEKQRKYVHNIAVSGRHLLQLVNEILDLTKVEAGFLKIEPEWFKLKLVLLEVTELMQTMLERKNVTLTYDIAPNLALIHADPARFKQIMINLLNNAIKFNREGGKVHVVFRWSENRQWVICDVADTGIGIPEGEIPKLFSLFYQVDNGYSRVEEGTGLGLALTRKLVELHGGTISVSSQEDVGSIFTFRLPKVVPC